MFQIEHDLLYQPLFLILARFGDLCVQICHRPWSVRRRFIRDRLSYVAITEVDVPKAGRSGVVFLTLLGSLAASEAGNAEARSRLDLPCSIFCLRLLAQFVPDNWGSSFPSTHCSFEKTNSERLREHFICYKLCRITRIGLVVN